LADWHVGQNRDWAKPVFRKSRPVSLGIGTVKNPLAVLRLVYCSEAQMPGKQYKYAVEMVRCIAWDNCGFTTSRDQFGRVQQTKITSRPILYLQDDDGRESKLEMAEFHRPASPL
jgi:hypothetical protein